MTKPYRCKNCGRSFRATSPVCECGADAVKDPKARNVVVPLVEIHYAVPHPVLRNKGTGWIACNPAKRVAGLCATGEPAVVTCPACRDTQAWQQNYIGEPALWGGGIEAEECC